MPGLLALPPEIRNHIWFFVESLVPTHFVVNAKGFTTRKVEGGNHILQGKILAWYCPSVSDQGANESDKADEEDKDDEKWKTIVIYVPNIAKVNQQIRSETLTIFCGANTFLIADLYLQLEGCHSPFPKILWAWLSCIKVNVPLIRRLELRCRCIQKSHEIITALMDSEFDFMPAALQEAKLSHGN